MQADARRIGQYTDDHSSIDHPQELANRLLTSVYLGTVNSSRATRARAHGLAEQIGADHLDVNIDGVVDAMSHLFATITGHMPRFRVSDCRQSAGLSTNLLQPLEVSSKEIWSERSTGDAHKQRCRFKAVSSHVLLGLAVHDCLNACAGAAAMHQPVWS